MLAQLAANIEADNIGQQRIEQDNIGLIAERVIECGPTAVNPDHTEISNIKNPRNQRPLDRIVLDNQHYRRCIDGP
jgi:hypothetical protein